MMSASTFNSFSYKEMTPSLFLSVALVGSHTYCSSQLPLWVIIETIRGSGGILGFWPHLRFPKCVIFSVSFLQPGRLLHQPWFPPSPSLFLSLPLSLLSIPRKSFRRRGQQLVVLNTSAHSRCGIFLKTDSLIRREEPAKVSQTHVFLICGC